MRFGLSLAIGAQTRASGGGGQEPTLILDFVGSNVPYGATLNLDFTRETFTAYTADPAGQGFPNFWAWS
jgi:hypothetical protein